MQTIRLSTVPCLSRFSARVATNPVIKSDSAKRAKVNERCRCRTGCLYRCCCRYRRFSGGILVEWRQSNGNAGNERWWKREREREKRERVERAICNTRELRLHRRAHRVNVAASRAQLAGDNEHSKVNTTRRDRLNSPQLFPCNDKAGERYGKSRRFMCAKHTRALKNICLIVTSLLSARTWKEINL